MIKFQIKAVFKGPGDAAESKTANAKDAGGQLKPKG